MKYDFACVAMLAPEKSPSALMNDKYFFRVMAVQRIGAARWLSRPADIEAMRFSNVHVLIGIFGNTGADDGEVFFLIAAGAARIDESIHARFKFAISNETILESGGH